MTITRITIEEIVNDTHIDSENVLQALQYAQTELSIERAQNSSLTRKERAMIDFLCAVIDEIFLLSIKSREELVRMNEQDLYSLWTSLCETQFSAYCDQYTRFVQKKQRAYAEHSFYLVNFAKRVASAYFVAVVQIQHCKRHHISF